MKWEAWAERVPFDGYRRPLIRVPAHEIMVNCRPCTGIPVVFAIMERVFVVWPYPERGWIANAFCRSDANPANWYVLTREAVDECEGPW